MNRNNPFVRKVIYISAIMLLLFPLFVLGQPASTTSSGGKLSQLRESYGLSQAQLGEIDPASVLIGRPNCVEPSAKERLI